MSLKKPSFLILNLAMISGLLLGAALQWQWQKSSSRAPAALAANGKSEFFKPDQLRIAKPNQSIDVRLEVIGGFPTHDNEDALLRVTLKLERDMQAGVGYVWVLPPGAELTSGLLREDLTGLSPGQEIIREITLRGFSSEGMPRNVQFEATGKVDGINIGASSVISSHPTRRDLSIGFRPSQEMLDEAVMQDKKLGNPDGNFDEETGEARIPAGLKL